MHFNEMFPSRFLKAEDVASPLLVEVEGVQIEPLGEDGEDKPICYFLRQKKPLVLNKTNAEMLTNLSGSEESEDWIGLKVELYQDSVLYRGKRTPCVRIRRPTRKAMGKTESQQSEDTVPETWEDEPTPKRKAS